MMMMMTGSSRGFLSLKSLSPRTACSSPILLPRTRRGFFSLPAFPRSTHHQEINKLDGLTAHDRYTKRGDLLVYNETKRLPYSKKQLYTVIADIEKYNQFIPYCLGSNLLSYRPLGQNHQTSTENIQAKPWIHGGYSGESHLLEHELIVGFKTFEEHYTSHVECRKWDMVKATASHSSLFKHLTSTWTFRSPEEISTKNAIPSGALDSSYVSLQLAFAFASPLHALIGEIAWKTVSERMVFSFETQLEKVYGKKETELTHQSGSSFDESLGVEK